MQLHLIACGMWLAVSLCFLSDRGEFGSGVLPTFRNTATQVSDGHLIMPGLEAPVLLNLAPIFCKFGQRVRHSVQLWWIMVMIRLIYSFFV